MRETALSHHSEGVLDSFAARFLDFHKAEPHGTLATADEERFLRAVHARENCAEAPAGIEVWLYGFPINANQPVEDIHVRCTGGDVGTGRQAAGWTGIFECARGRHVDVLTWPAANAIVVAAANAIYIVDPSHPEQFSGLAAPVEITDVTFDESGQHMFVADSLRIYAFTADRRLRWMSEPLDGYDARFVGCGGRVLAVQLKQSEPGRDGEEAAPSVIRLRTEDGTVLRSRFRLAHSYWVKSRAA